MLEPAGEAGLARDSQALSEQIRTVSSERLQERFASLSEKRPGQIPEALDRHFWLE